MSCATPPDCSPERAINPHRVLLIEDSPGDAELLRRTLESDAPGTFEIDHADRLAEARDRLEKGRYEAILVDLSLPDGYGRHTIDAIRGYTRDQPVIVLSGTDDDALAMNAIEAGAIGHLHKVRLGEDDTAQHLLRMIAMHRRTVRCRRMRHPESAETLLRDELTGLATAHVYEDRLENAIARMQRRSAPFAVLRMTLRWDTVEDQSITRALIVAIGERLASRARRSDTLAHLGNGAFAMILEGVCSLSQIHSTVGAMAALVEAVELDSSCRPSEEPPTLTAGLAICPEDGLSRTALDRTAARRTLARLTVGTGAFLS